MGWTDERVETLKKLWLDGLSASQIAKQLGGVTRNGVIGKVHRLGLAGRATPSAPHERKKVARPAPIPATPRARKAPRPAPIPTAPRERKEVTEKVVEPAAPLPYVDEPGSATILTIDAHMCKWPIGDPSADNFTFCGKRFDDDGPYCVGHARVAYQPQQGNKKSGADLARSLRRYL